MKFGTQLATLVTDLQSDPKVEAKIKRWIDSNTLFVDQHCVWCVGITTAEHILLVESQVRQDLECKHWKYWQAGNFQNAMELIREFNKYPFIFKSPLNEYIGKGTYVFVYKTIIPNKNYFFHTPAFIINLYRLAL